MMIWKMIIVGLGILLMCADFYAYVYKKFTEIMGLSWGIVAVFFILLGVIPGLSDWTRLMTDTKFIGIFSLIVVMIVGAFFICMLVSQLVMKIQELAMQVSLLNQENERMLKQLEILTENSN